LSAQIQSAKQFRRHGLVTSGLVAESPAVEQANQQVEQRNREPKFAPRQKICGPQIARAVDDQGFAATDWLDQARPIVGIVFEVGVLDNRNGAAGAGQRGSHGSTLAAIELVAQHEDVGMAGPTIQDGGSAVIAAIIHDKDFLVGVGCL